MLRALPIGSARSGAFSSEVDTGSRQENASNLESRAPFRFHRNGNGSSRGRHRPRYQPAALMRDDDHSAITVSQAKSLFADWKSAPAIVLAVSGGPDSIALMWLAARWRRALTRGPRLIAVTGDHRLRGAAGAGGPARPRRPRA